MFPAQLHLAQICMARSTRICLCRARSDAARDCLMWPVVSEHIASLLCARDIGRLSAAGTQYGRALAELVRRAMREQHGMFIDVGSLVDLHALENVQSECSVDLRRADARRVENGSALCSIHVGSMARVITRAQCPPASGDSWSLDVALRKGVYSLRVSGWRNPAHGILDVFLDGVRVTPLGGFDWCRSRTTKQVCWAKGIRVRWTGVHRLVGKTSRTSADHSRTTRYWMCLRRIELKSEAGPT